MQHTNIKFHLLIICCLFSLYNSELIWKVYDSEGQVFQGSTVQFANSNYAFAQISEQASSQQQSKFNLKLSEQNSDSKVCFGLQKNDQDNTDDSYKYCTDGDQNNGNVQGECKGDSEYNLNYNGETSVLEITCKRNQDFKATFLLQKNSSDVFMIQTSGKAQVSTDTNVDSQNTENQFTPKASAKTKKPQMSVKMKAKKCSLKVKTNIQFKIQKSPFQGSVKTKNKAASTKIKSQKNSSVRVLVKLSTTAPDPEPQPQPEQEVIVYKCVTLYSECNYQGKEKQMCDQDIPISYINGPDFVAKSIKVQMEDQTRVKIIDGVNEDTITTSYSCIAGAGFNLLAKKKTYLKHNNKF